MQTQSSSDTNAGSRSESTRNDEGIVLVVDDEQDILELVGEALSELGRKVVTARNGDIALVILESGLKVELLFTDVVMPGSLDGITLAARARQLDPNIKILYGTGHVGLRLTDDNVPLYGEVLHKPYRLAELAQRVKTLITAGGTTPPVEGRC
jgi:CheY-like chemotaxis protein